MKVSRSRGLNSPAFYNKKKKKIRTFGILGAVAIVLLISSVVWISRQERFLITDILITGKNGVAEKEEITKQTKYLIDGYYFGLIPRKNILVYPRDYMKMHLLKAFPRLKSVDLKLEESRILSLEVEEHEPFALYCEILSDGKGISLPTQLREKAQAGECFFLDKDGFIFALAPSFSGDVYFIYASTEALENPRGKQFLEVETFRALVKFQEKLTALNINPIFFEAGNDEYRLFTPNGAQVIWRSGDDLAFLYSNLEAFLSEDSIRREADFLDRVLYLDLRTGNKVFYKFR